MSNSYYAKSVFDFTHTFSMWIKKIIKFWILSLSKIKHYESRQGIQVKPGLYVAFLPWFKSRGKLLIILRYVIIKMFLRKVPVSYRVKYIFTN